jgi:hypothetical protein
MSKRLQVLLSEADMLEIKKVAERQQLSVGEWVRRTLRHGVKDTGGRTAEEINAVLDWAANLPDRDPAPPIEQMLAEIEQGYLSGPA